MPHANIGEMNKRFPKAIHDNILIGSLIVHKYKPELLWLAVRDNPATSCNIPWRNDEIGLVLKIDEWGEHDSPERDKFICIMISSGIGYCFGSDVELIK